MTYIPSLVYLWTMRSMKGRDVDDMLSQGTDYPFCPDHKIDLENIWVYGQVAHARGQEVRGSDPPGASYGINFEN